MTLSPLYLTTSIPCSQMNHRELVSTLCDNLKISSIRDDMMLRMLEVLAAGRVVPYYSQLGYDCTLQQYLSERNVLKCPHDIKDEGLERILEIARAKPSESDLLFMQDLLSTYDIESETGMEYILCCLHGDSSLVRQQCQHVIDVLYTVNVLARSTAEPVVEVVTIKSRECGCYLL